MLLFAFALSAVGSQHAFAHEVAKKLDAVEADLKSSPTDNGRMSRRSNYSAIAAKVVDDAEARSLTEIANSDNLCLALLAAWQRVKTDKSRSPDARAEWFIGFFEAKIGNEPPSRWRGILHESLGNKLPQDPSARGKLAMTKTIKIGRLVVSHSDSLQVEVRDRALVFRSHGLECAASPELLVPEGARGNVQLGYYLDKEVLVVALADDSGSSFPISAFDRKNGDIMWRSTVWGNLTAESGQFRTGAFWHNFQIDREKDRIRVWGESGPAYFEELSLSKGECRFRFSTCCWYGRRYAELYGKLIPGYEQSDRNP